MDTNEAREHLEMVDRILTNAGDEGVCLIPGLLVAWGVAAAVMDVGQQLYFSNHAARAGLWLAEAALLFGILYSVAVAVSMIRNTRYERVSIIERRMGSVMGAVWLCVLVAAFAQPHVFAGWGGAAVWNVGAAIMMLIAGFDGDRRALAGGIVLLASVLAANYVFAHTPGYALAGGFILGYAVPGVLLLADPRGAN